MGAATICYYGVTVCNLYESKSIQKIIHQEKQLSNAKLSRLLQNSVTVIDSGKVCWSVLALYVEKK